MEIQLNPDGTRNRLFTPYIDQEEYHRNYGLYDPNGRGMIEGLYSAYPPIYCQSWVSYVDQHMAKLRRRDQYLDQRIQQHNRRQDQYLEQSIEERLNSY